MISFKNVVKKFRLDSNTVIVPVNDVNLTVNDGEFIIIIGRSGSGKTTLLNLAAGLIRPTSGQVYMDNRNMGEMTDSRISAIRGQRLGFIFQFPSLLPSLSVLENITLPNMFATKKNPSSKERAKELVETLGLDGKLDVYPRQLSAGEQKRVVIARSLMNHPDLILADEPTSDLDHRTENEVMQIMKDINSTGVTFIIVTHSQQLVPMATRAFEMQNGKLSLLTA